jgi:hypothetical protein
MAVELVELATVFAFRLPAQVATVDVMPYTKHLVKGGFVQGRDQLKQLPKPLAQVCLDG